MTSCTFNYFNFASTVLNINSRANTISHICTYGLYANTNNGLKTLFLYTKQPKDSFIKFFYSSIVGNVPMNGENQKPNFLIQIDSKIATRYQCNNISNFEIKNDDNIYSHPSYGIIGFTAPDCLNFVMSIFRNCKSSSICYFDIQDGDYSFRHYVGMCNFKDWRGGNSIIFMKMHNKTQICFENCIFQNPEQGDYVFYSNENGVAFIRIENCVFNSGLKFYKLKNYSTYNLNLNITDYGTHDLAHYIVDGVCLGTHHDNAYGCQNDTCPDKGCNPSHFQFKDEDVPYTEIFHDDVDTPTPSPTVAFSQSSHFSISSAFSESIDFSNSFYFTPSNHFSETNGFTQTGYFFQNRMQYSSLV